MTGGVVRSHTWAFSRARLGHRPRGGAPGAADEPNRETMLLPSWIALALLAVLASAQRLAEHETEPLRCRVSAGRPAIDGILDNACWRRTDVATGFTLLERSSWAAMLHSFHEPAHFGHLLFVPPS